MVIVRPVRKLHGSLPLSSDTQLTSTTALGDWYLKRIVVDRHPLLILVSSTSLLTILAPARDVRGLPIRLADLVVSRLKRYGVDPQLIDAERNAMSAVAIAPTADRSVIGIMIEIGKELPFRLEIGGWDETTPPFVEAQLARTPWHAGRRESEVVWPDQAIHRLLADRWRAEQPSPP
jgi:hypothetical protein